MYCVLFSEPFVIDAITFSAGCRYLAFIACLTLTWIHFLLKIRPVLVVIVYKRFLQTPDTRHQNSAGNQKEKNQQVAARPGTRSRSRSRSSSLPAPKVLAHSAPPDDAAHGGASRAHGWVRRDERSGAKQMHLESRAGPGTRPSASSTHLSAMHLVLVVRFFFLPICL